jgi:DNA modification methylase
VRPNARWAGRLDEGRPERAVRVRLRAEGEAVREPMNPHWSSDRAVVYHGDGLSVLEGLEDASVDAVITDPPYCSGAVSEASRTAAKSQGFRSERLKRFGWFIGDNMGTAGLAWLIRAIAFEAVRVVKPTGSLLVFCDWRQVPNLEPAIESAGWRFQGLVTWDKGSIGMGLGFRAQSEFVLHFTNGSPEYHDTGTANVIAVPRLSVADEKVHQTQKPVELLRRLLRVVAPPDGLVVDPFMGSGSTGVAALAEGRRFLGVERDPSHVATSIGRLGGRVPRELAGAVTPGLFDT